VRKRYVARGMVQGVGFRWFVRDAAAKLSVTGWVRNLGDGSVELEAQAGENTLTAFEAEVKNEHPWAHVSELQTQVIAPVEREAGFDIRT